MRRRSNADGFFNRWFLDPVFRGSYPADMLEYFEPSAPPVEDGDLETIAAPLDFIGVNYYSRQVLRANPDGGRPLAVRNPDAAYTAMDWEIYPDGLFDVLVRVRDDYDPPPIYITENGAAFGDHPTHDGEVDDPERWAYIEAHLEAIRRAIDAGVPMAGYFVWSLLDNFEWARGYSKRFGIVYPDLGGRALDWDPMSYGTAAPTPAHLFGWHKWLLRWLDPPQLTCLTAPGTLEETLTPIAVAGGKKIVVVPITASFAYVVEARRRIGFDSHACEEGVVIYSVDSQRTGNDNAIVMRGPVRCGLIASGAFRTGTSFEDERVKVEVLASDGRDYRVRVTKK